MKTLGLFFVLALMCCFTLNSVAQSKSDHVVASWFIPFECDGVPDVLTGTVNLHRVMNFNTKTNVLEWVKLNFNSEVLVSESTGEVFSVNLTRKIDIGEFEEFYITRLNLKGNAGTHILITKYWIYDVANDEWTDTDETKCL